MEDTELEEGEACSYHNTNEDYDYDASIDPDIALSYIEEKLQDVLGHFQKDFEGGVSAENLGAKFGGYGSFLPAYQRSPVWSHPRTPQKIQQYNRSPNNLQLEGGRCSVASSLAAPQSPRHETGSTNEVLQPVLKPSTSLIDSVKSELCVPSTYFTEEAAPRSKFSNKKAANLLDPKMLKVRIKMGSDNLSTQKNAAIYSGLGLDVSPSLSVDDSPSESEGMFHEPQDTIFDSPSNIIRIMTSFPVHGGLLLSPLSDDLIHLTEKEKLPRDRGSFPAPVILENSRSIVSGLGSIKGDRKISGEMNTKLLEKTKISTVLKSGNNKDFRSSIDNISREIDIETLDHEELISNTLKLPLLSNSYSDLGDGENGKGRAPNISKEVENGLVRGKGFSDITKMEQLMPIFIQENGWIENAKSSSTRKAWDDKKDNSVDSASIYPRKDGHRKAGNPIDLVKMDKNVSMGTKGLNSEPTEFPKEKAPHEATSNELEGFKLPLGKESSSSGGKKKVKGSQSKVKVVAAEIAKESSRDGSSLTSKIKKGTYGEHAMKVELEDFKSLNNTVKSGDRYRDFFWDIELEEAEKETSPLEMSYEDRLKDSDGIEKSTNGTYNMSWERSSGKKTNKLSTSESYPKAASNVLPPSGNGPISDVTPAETAHIMTQENWVCCDKCQKWRLLPLGKNPNDLPEKWLCSMLNWLPGKNRCSFSEEETTNALRALYQLPAPESQSSLQSTHGGITSNAMLADIWQPDKNNQTFGSHALLAGEKKMMHGSKEISNTNLKDSTTNLLNSIKKSTEQTAKNGSLNDVKRSPMVSEPNFLQLRKSNDAAVRKNKHKQKDKYKVLDNYSDAVDTMRMQSEIKGKRDADRDFSKVSKKVRNEVLSENWMSNHGEDTEKAGPSLSNGIPTVSLGKNLVNDKDYTSSKDFKLKREDQVQVSEKKLKDKVKVSLDDRPMDVGKHNNKDVSKKRKLKENHDAQTYQGFVLNTGHQLQDRILAKKEVSENDYSKEKKIRVSRFEGKESSASKGVGRTDKKDSHRSQHVRQDMESTVSHRILDGKDSLKRDSGSLNHSGAATSSSSKVSGSHKSKGNFHEAKESPVESVSSSPMRVLKAENLTSVRSAERDDLPGPIFFAPGDSRKSSDGEDEGRSDKFGTARKEKALDVVQHGSIESSVLDIQEKDFIHASGDKHKMQILPSPDFTNRHFANGSAEYLSQDSKHPSKTTSDQWLDDESSHHHVNGSSAKKSGKGYSSRSKDKIRKFHLEPETGTVNVSDSINKMAPSYEVKPLNGKKMIDEKIGVTSDGNEKKYITKQNSEGLLLIESAKRDSKSNTGEHNAPDVTVDALGQDAPPLPAKQNTLLECEAVSGREKSISLPSREAKNDAIGHCPQLFLEAYKGNGANSMAINASNGDNSLKAQKKNREVDHPNGIHHNTSRIPPSNGHRAKDLDTPNPVRRESTSQAAANAVKEAKNLKHLADRLKNSGSNSESTKFYFEAALKFLHGASLLETCCNENAKTGETIQSIHMYSSTAKLCEFCAHEYEKSKDMAAAALAYKCMEVAYMRVIYSSHTNANRDRHELQMALQMIPGESPSSSTSDVDNLNHPTTVDKVPLAKGISSPQITGSHSIAAQNRPNFVRLLNFAHDVNFAMEASRKSQLAFAAANSQHKDNISSIKTALDFNYQDVEGLLRLVRHAIEAISR